MKERTVTETSLEHAVQGRPHRAAPGVVIVFQRGRPVGIPHRVAGAKRLGRDDGADVTVDDPTLSRFHALLEPAPGGVRVTDLGSRNGAFVDGARVVDDKTFASFGTVLRFGRTLLLALEDVTPFELASDDASSPLVGGAALAGVRAQIATFARLASALLIEGEMGTGKEVVASLLHEASGRSGRFVAVNCAALTGELVESELFGHARGAFSGALGARAGLFRSADGGTLLLDEIGELPAAAQAKLLRAIETGRVRGVGEDADAAVDVRVIAATNRDLDDMATRGSFRADLLHRVAAVRIRLPPLRKRLEDVPRLVAHFLRQEELEPSVGLLELFLGKRWPGNVRELRNALTGGAAVARAAGRDEVRAGDVTLGDAPAEADDESPLRTRITRALTAAGGNVTRAAQELQMARSGLYETLRRLDIDPASFRTG